MEPRRHLLCGRAGFQRPLAHSGGGEGRGRCWRAGDARSLGSTRAAPRRSDAGPKPQHSREDSYNILPPILQIEISHVIEDIDVVYKGDTQVSIYKNMIVQIIY